LSFRILSVVTLCASIGLSACERSERSQSDIYLPEGDAAAGKEHFVSLGCAGCHSVVGAELPEAAESAPVRVLLGSRTGRVKSYGQLVTSIVNPSHRVSGRYIQGQASADGDTQMARYNDVLTVTQLTDLVAFLQAHYERIDYPRYKYTVYSKESDEDAEASK